MISDIKTPAVKISGKDTKVFSKDTCDLSSHPIGVSPAPPNNIVTACRMTSLDFFPFAAHHSISRSASLYRVYQQQTVGSWCQGAKIGPLRRVCPACFSRQSVQKSWCQRAEKLLVSEFHESSVSPELSTSFPIPVSRATPSIWVAQNLGRPFPTWDLQNAKYHEISKAQVWGLQMKYQSYHVRDRPIHPEKFMASCCATVQRSDTSCNDLNGERNKIRSTRTTFTKASPAVGL